MSHHTLPPQNPLPGPSLSRRWQLAAAAALIAGASASAEIKTWTPSGGSTNLAGANWSPAGVPTSADTALFSTVSASTLTTGNTLNWGLLSWAANTNTTLQLSSGASGNRELNLSGIGGQLINVSTGTLNLSGTPNGSGFRLGLTLAASGTFTVDAGASLSISSPITGSANVTKAGAGTLLIYGNNQSIYTGTTTVAGGILGGTGGIRDVVVQNGSTIAPGGPSSTGTLRSYNLSLDSGSTFALKLNTSTSQSSILEATGNLNLSPGALLSLTDLGSDLTLTLGTTFTFLDYSGVWNGGLFTHNSSQLADDAIFAFGANSYQISYNGVDGFTSAVTLTTVVPEPSAAVLALAGCGVFSLGRRRRRSQADPEHC